MTVGKKIVIESTKLTSVISNEPGKYSKEWCFVLDVNLETAKQELQEAAKTLSVIKYLCYAEEQIAEHHVLVGYVEIKYNLKKSSMKKKIKCLKDAILMKERKPGKAWNGYGEVWVQGGILPDGSTKEWNNGFWESKQKMETRGRPRKYNIGRVVEYPTLTFFGCGMADLEAGMEDLWV